jgi:hypothetical protein
VALGADMVVAVSCAGGVAACAGGVTSCEGAACEGAGSVAEGDVIACDADGVLDCEAIGADGAGVTASELEGMAVSELDDDVLAVVGSVATLRLLRVDAVTLFVERDASREGLAFDSGAGSTSFAFVSFTTLLDFAGGVAGGDDSIGTLGAAGTFA